MMAAKGLTEQQTRVLAMVCASAPHATLAGLAYMLEARPHIVQLSLDALTRRGLVTPVQPTSVVAGVVIAGEGEAYTATTKGRNRVR